jgi:hypothetical protein
MCVLMYAVKSKSAARATGKASLGKSTGVKSAEDGQIQEVNLDDDRDVVELDLGLLYK